MKKLSILLVLMVIAVGVKAQGHYIIPTIGTNAGLGIWLNERTYSSSINQVVMKFGTGFSAGVSYRYEFRKPFLIEAGLLYNNYQQRFGVSKVNKGPEIRWNELVRYNQMAIPIYFGYKFAIGSKKTFSITPKIGLLYCYCLNGKFVYSDLYDMMEEHKFEVKESDFGVNLGVDFGWKLNERLDIFVSIMEQCAFGNTPGYDVLNYRNIINCSTLFSGNVGLKINVGNL